VLNLGTESGEARVTGAVWAGRDVWHADCLDNLLLADTNDLWDLTCEFDLSWVYYFQVAEKNLNVGVKREQQERV